MLVLHRSRDGLLVLHRSRDGLLVLHRRSQPFSSREQHGEGWRDGLLESRDGSMERWLALRPREGQTQCPLPSQPGLACGPAACGTADLRPCKGQTLCPLSAQPQSSDWDGISHYHKPLPYATTISHYLHRSSVVGLRHDLPSQLPKAWGGLAHSWLGLAHTVGSGRLALPRGWRPIQQGTHDASSRLTRHTRRQQQAGKAHTTPAAG